MSRLDSAGHLRDGDQSRPVGWIDIECYVDGPNPFRQRLRPSQCRSWRVLAQIVMVYAVWGLMARRRLGQLIVPALVIDVAIDVRPCRRSASPLHA